MAKTFIQDAWDNQYCADHQKRLVKCQSCGRLISEALTRGGVEHRGGPSICNLCHPTAILDSKQASQLTRSVCAFLSKLNLDIDPTTIPLTLVNNKTLRKASKNRRDEVRGLCRTRTTMQGKKVMDHRPEEILILKGLPKEHFCMVAVHEFTHAWIAWHKVRGLSKRDEEGLCCLMEFLWLREQKTPMAKFRLKQLNDSKDPIYGKGLTQAKAALKQHGLPTILSSIRTEKRLPRIGLLGKFLT
ncbi:protein DA1 [Magnetococcus sp. PR-3]|uniref:protein DA1 n=1 Tax=Magnetococcus sp. PR-3 TaxID=3120355 RepID=UPI002FCE484F